MEKKQIRLYDIDRKSRVKAETFNEAGDKIGDFIVFHHLDGAYSYCRVEGSDEVVHISASQPLKKVDDHYELINEKVDD